MPSQEYSTLYAEDNTYIKQQVVTRPVLCELGEVFCMGVLANIGLNIAYQITKEVFCVLFQILYRLPQSSYQLCH